MAISSTSYSGTAKALHWTIVVLLITQFILAWTCRISAATRRSQRSSACIYFGVIILAVAIVRLGCGPRTASRRRSKASRMADIWRASPALAAIMGCYLSSQSFACSTPIGAACVSSCSGWNYRN